MTQPFHTNGLRFECQRCGYCCSAACGRSFVYLSGADRRLLALHFGMRSSSFTQRYCFNMGGAFYMNARVTDCPFLDGADCTVHEARPTQCRTWPFWAENMNEESWQREAKTFCPGIDKGRLYTYDEIEALLGLAED